MKGLKLQQALNQRPQWRSRSAYFRHRGLKYINELKAKKEELREKAHAIDGSVLK